VTVAVTPERCVGCGLCAAQFPTIFTMRPGGKAAVTQPRHTWSPLGDVAVRICPSGAISAEEHLPLARPLAS
jgi:ferredoxin